MSFITPPKIEITAPKEGETVTKREILVIGKTDPDAVVRVNNQPVLLTEDGNFITEVEIFEGTKEIEVKAISRSGKETIIRRKIKVELEK